MSQATAGASASGLVRVTVASGTRRVDLVLPGAVPVAELVPELARSVGLLDPVTVYGGYRLVTQEGRELAGDAGLIMQGIEDGGLLTVAAGVDDDPPRVYDDVVEAMTDVVERDLKPWEPASGRRTALSAAGLLMVLGAVALFIQGTLLASTAAAVVSVALVVGAIVLSRVQHEPEASVAVAWMGCFYAAVAGFMFAPDDVMIFGLPVAWAGAGALGAGLVALVGLGEGRTLVIPPIVVGAIFLATGLVMRAATFDPAVVLTTTLTLVVMAGSIFPWLALGATGTTVDQLYTTADITADPDEIDPTRVSADARVAHEILVAVSATVGLLLVLIAPAGGVARRDRRRARGHVLPRGHAPHPPVPHRHRGAGRPGVRHPRPALGRHLHAVAAPRLAAHRRGGAVGDRRGPAGGDPAPVGAVGTPRPVRRPRRDRRPAVPAAAARSSRPASSPRSEAEADRWPPRRTSSRPTPSADADSSPRSSPARPAVARSSRPGRAARSSAAWRSPYS